MNKGIKLILVALTLGVASCSKETKIDDQSSLNGQHLEIQIMSHAINEEPGFFASANALSGGKTSNYIDIKINGTIRGNLATITDEDLESGKISIEPNGLSKLLTVSYTIEPMETTMFTVFRFVDGKQLPVEAIYVDSGISKSGFIQLSAEK